MFNAKLVDTEASCWVTAPSTDKELSGGIHLPGLPNNPFPIPGITELMCEKLFTLQPHYFGTYDSSGSFQPSQSHLVIKHWLAQSGSSISDLRSGARSTIPSNWPVISAHSFGTYVCMQYLLHETRHLNEAARPKVAIFFAPMFSFGDEARTAGIVLDLEMQARFIERCFPKTFRVPSPGALDKFFKSRAQFPDPATLSDGIRCIFIAGAADPTLDVSVSQKFVKKFCDSRPELSYQDYIVVEGGGHDVPSLLNAEVKARLSSLISSVLQ